MLKKMLRIIGKTIGFCSLFFASVSANTTCVFIYHQPELPEKVKELRKI